MARTTRSATRQPAYTVARLAADLEPLTSLYAGRWTLRRVNKHFMCATADNGVTITRTLLDGEVKWHLSNPLVRKSGGGPDVTRLRMLDLTGELHYMMRQVDAWLVRHPGEAL